MNSETARRDDAKFLRYFAASLTYSETTAEGEAKHRLHEIAMRIETSGYAHPAKPAGEADGWLPIETAPKDGTSILISFGAMGVRQVAWMDCDGRGFPIWSVDDGKFGPYPLRGWNSTGPNAPAHWRPLPPPPRASLASATGESA